MKMEGWSWRMMKFCLNNVDLDVTYCAKAKPGWMGAC